MVLGGGGIMMKEEIMVTMAEEGMFGQLW
jgi:hypothetical protein